MPEFLSLVRPAPERAGDPEPSDLLEELKTASELGGGLETAPIAGPKLEAPDEELDPLEEIVFGEHLFL